MNDQPLPPLIIEATKKASIVWVGVKTAPAQSMWCTWATDALCVVSGPGEQRDPGLADVTECTVHCRGDHGGRILTLVATVEQLKPHTEIWAEVASALASKRLNAVGDTTHRWAQHNELYRLVPNGEMQSGTQLPSDALSAPMSPNSATTATPKPFRLHRVKRRKRT